MVAAPAHQTATAAAAVPSRQAETWTNLAEVAESFLLDQDRGRGADLAAA
jgi:hypothetical protein